jgi:hypothetical protein
MRGKGSTERTSELLLRSRKVGSSLRTLTQYDAHSAKSPHSLAKRLRGEDRALAAYKTRVRYQGCDKARLLLWIILQPIPVTQQLVLLR